MLHIGNLGHSAILLPASLVLVGCLLWFGRRADATALSAALTICLLVTLVAKLAFHACESELPALGIQTPSGHASFSTVFYGCGALIAMAGRPFWQKISVYVGTVLMVLLVGASRVVVRAHTLPDVIAGISIGVFAIVVFQLLRGPSRSVAIPYKVLALGIPAAAILVTIVLVFARHWTPENLIESAALRLDHSLSLCLSP
jgi:membrane-associated phospholipid phosphatase